MPAVKGDMYINTHCNYSQPTLIKLDNENIGGHLTPLHLTTFHYSLCTVSTVWTMTLFAVWKALCGTGTGAPSFLVGPKLQTEMKIKPFQNGNSNRN